MLRSTARKNPALPDAGCKGSGPAGLGSNTIAVAKASDAAAHGVISR